MSVYYEVYEHLIVRDTAKHSVEVDNIFYRLSLLAAWELQRRGNVGTVEITADSKKFRFEGNILSEDFREALDALRGAWSVEVSVNYGCSVNALEIDPTPFSLMEYLDNALVEDPCYLDGLFYCVYHNADCADSGGSLRAYGRKNSILYTGAVPFEAVDHIPDGDWYTPVTAVVCEVDAADGRDLTQIEAVCRQLQQFDCTVKPADLPENSVLNPLFKTLTRTGDSLCFTIDNLRLHNDAELKAFTALYAKLIDLTGGQCSLIGEMADISQPDVKLLHFDVEADGKCTMKLAAVAD